MVALREVAAELLESGELAGGLDALGGDLYTQRTGE